MDFYGDLYNNNMPMQQGDGTDQGFGGMNDAQGFGGMAGDFYGGYSSGYGSSYTDPYSQFCGGYGEMGNFKAPTPSTVNIQGYITKYLNANGVLVPMNAIDWVKLSEPPYGTLKHACKANLLALNSLEPMQLQHFDNASITMAFCPACLKVLYHVERLL